MKEFGELIWAMDGADFGLLFGAVVVWAHVVWAAVVLGGRKRG